MIHEELARFLASVRRTRFVDYLDPMGETAHEALERRLKWAARSRYDPAHADEADFLLRHEAALRELVTQELVEGDDDWVESAEVGSEWGQHSWGQSAPAAPVQERQPTAQPAKAAPAPAPAAADPDDYDPDFEGTGIMRLEDFTNPPVMPRAQGPDDVDELPQAVVRDIWSRNAPEGASGPQQHDVVSEDEEEISGPPPVAPASPTRTPEEAPRSALDIRASRTGAAASRPTASAPGPSRLKYVLIPTFLALGGVAAAVGLGVLEIPEGLLDRGAALVEADAPAAPADPPEPEVEVADAPEPEDVDEAEPEDPDAADDPDATDPEAADAVAAAVAAPVPAPAAPAPKPPAPVAAAPKPKPAPPPAPVAEAPKPKPAPAPVAEAPKPAPVAEAPKPAPTPPPAPVAEAPKPAPTPPPAPVAEAPKPAPEPAPEVVAAAAPEPALPEAVEYPQLSGLWVGLAASRSFQLAIDSQSGGSFSGNAEMMNEAGEWEKVAVLGKVKPDGAVSFSQIGGGFTFAGKVDGIRASGTLKDADGESQKWSVIK